MTNEHAQGPGMKEEEAGHQICMLSVEERKEGGMGMQHVDSRHSDRLTDGTGQMGRS